MTSSGSLTVPKGYIPAFLMKDKNLIFNGNQLTKSALSACKSLVIKPEDLIPK